MTYTVTTYPQGTISWADFFSRDIAASKKFYCELFGWTSEDMPTGKGRPDYTMFYLDGNAVAGGSPTFDSSMPSFWSTYVSVTNIDEVTAKVEPLGGKVTMNPMNVLDSGRMSSIMDPTGAHISLWQPKKHIGAQLVNTVGAMSWNELYTKDVKTAESFYSSLFGWSFEKSPQTGDYIVIKNNGRSNGGVMSISPAMETTMPPRWIVYFTVKNANASVAKVKELGGTVYIEKDISIGKIAMVADPAGASLILLEMSITPDPWISDS